MTYMAVDQVHGCLGLFIKRRRQSSQVKSEGVCADILWIRGGLQLRTSTRFGAKTLDLSKFMMCLHARASAEKFSGGKGSNGKEDRKNSKKDQK